MKTKNYKKQIIININCVLLLFIIITIVNSELKDVSKNVKFTDIQVLERLNNLNKFQFEHLINNDKRNITLNKIKEMNKIMKEKHHFNEIKDKTDINEEMTIRIQMND